MSELAMALAARPGTRADDAERRAAAVMSHVLRAVQEGRKVILITGLPGGQMEMSCLSGE